jgi:hypothetical protein
MKKLLIYVWYFLVICASYVILFATALYLLGIIPCTEFNKPLIIVSSIIVGGTSLIKYGYKFFFEE